MPASGAMAADPMFSFSTPEVDNSPMYSGTLGDSSNMTVVRVGGNVSDDKVKVFYMALGVAFIYGCCYYGSSNDPFYDTAEYREDGGDGTSNWFYSLDSNAEKASREDLLAKLRPSASEDSEEWDEFAELKK